MNKLAHLIAMTVVSGMVACLADSTTVLAQAGSVGGTIGKQEKSISGDTADSQHAVPASRPPRSTGPRRSEEKASKKDEGTGSKCGRIPGVWTANGWYNAIYGRGDVVLNADGSARHVSGIVGTWTCSGSHFVMNWKNWAHGEGTLSNDGNTVTYADGATMTRGK